MKRDLSAAMVGFLTVYLMVMLPEPLEYTTAQEFHQAQSVRVEWDEPVVVVGVIPASATVAPRIDPVWDALADCESGSWDKNGRPMENTARWDYSSGFFQGGLQFHPKTWAHFAGQVLDDPPSHAYLANREDQIAVAVLVQEVQGWKAWPICSIKVGLRPS